jgi:thymidine phosphorylase
MSQPLATAAGNALEVIEVMETLTGTSVNTALWDVTVALGGEVLALAGLAADVADGEARIAQALESGAAADMFGRMVAAQGGPADFVDRWPDRLPAAPVVARCRRWRTACRHRIDGEALGFAVVGLGGGRRREGDRVNPSVGLSDLAGLGEEAGAGVPLAMVHAATEDAAAEAVGGAGGLSDRAGPVAEPPLVMKRIG